MQFVGSETYDRRLDLPAGVLLLGELPAGNTLSSLSFSFYDSVTERRSVVHNIPYNPNSPYSHNGVETMIGEAHETWLAKVRAEGKKKPTMTVEQRKEFGKILEEIRVNKNKRNESTNNKIYYEGTNNGRQQNRRQFRR
jgi:hypothetical protein